MIDMRFHFINKNENLDLRIELLEKAKNKKCRACCIRYMKILLK